jgi:arabinofuranosyltransferase
VENISTLKKWIWVLLVLMLGWVLAPVRSYEDMNSSLDSFAGIADEMFGYYPYTNLRHIPSDTLMPDTPWTRRGEELRAKGETVSVEGAIGMLGYFAGPNVHIIDTLSLADPCWHACRPTTHLNGASVTSRGRCLKAIAKL